MPPLTLPAPRRTTEVAGAAPGHDTGRSTAPATPSSYERASVWG